MAKCDFLGKVFTSKNYGDFKVVEYLGSENIKIVFLNTGYQTTVAATTIRKGSVKDRLAPSVCGVGVVGDDSVELSDDAVGAVVDVRRAGAGPMLMLAFQSHERAEHVEAVDGHVP